MIMAEPGRAVFTALVAQQRKDATEDEGQPRHGRRRARKSRIQKTVQNPAR
jgi:hypothetical protein